MWIIVLILLLLGAHFNGTAFVPGDRAWFGWPFGKDSRPLLGFVGGLPGQEGAVITPLLAGVAVLGFLAAVLALLGGHRRLALATRRRWRRRQADRLLQRAAGHPRPDPAPAGVHAGAV